MSRHAGPVRWRFSSPSARRYLDAGRKLLGEAIARGTAVQTLRHELPDGAVILAQRYGSQLIITINAPGEGETPPLPQEEVIHLFVSADDGLHIYDLTSKRQVQLITGLGAYTVHAVDAGFAYLSNPGATGQLVAVRVDVSALSAFGYTYTVKTSNSPSSDPPIDGFATGFEAGGFTLAPDGTRALLHFGGSMTTGGSIREGVGGYLLIDAATLAPLRAPIRMGFKPSRAAWSADGARFYLGVDTYADVGDDVTNAHLSALTTATSDGIAAFDRDGTLLGTTVLATWPFTPDAGFNRLLQALGADDRFVYAAIAPAVGSGLSPMLYVLDPALAVLASFNLGGIGTATPAQLVPIGSTLYAVYSDRIATFAIAADGTPSLTEVSVSSDLNTQAQTRGDTPATLRPGVRSRVGRPPDARRFLFRQASGVAVIAGYLGFADPPKAQYTLDLNLVSPGRTWKTDFALANAGVRAIPGRREGGVITQ